MKNFNRPALKIFLSYYKPHIALFIGDMICAALISLIDIVFPIVSRYAVNVIIPEKQIKTFFIMIAVLVIVYILRKTLYHFINYWGHVFGTRVEMDMRKDIFEHLEKQSFSFYDTHRTGQIMSRVTNDLFEVTELAHHGPEDVFISTLTLLGSFILLLKIRWQLAIVVLVAIPLMLFVIVSKRREMKKTSSNVKEKIAEINSSLESSLSGIRVTQVFTNEEYEEKKFSETNKEFFSAKKVFYKTFSGMNSSIEFYISILGIAVLFTGGYLIMKDKMNVSDLIAANLFVAAFSAPVKRLVSFFEQFTTGMAGFNRFLEIMRTDTSIKESENTESISQVQGNIEFRNVSFSYGEKNGNVLENINLNIKSGEKFALVGASGGGKTTICNLIPRFYEIQSGSILLDGKDIKKLKLSDLRKNIAVVQQDVFLFAGTIKENIAYGKPDASFEEIVECAKKAEIHEDIMKMCDGYDSVVGERGIKLSGGQKQRIAIARCFLKNPPILILDEATSALDTTTEIKIQRAFDELSKGRTTLIIAHRLSTIKNADNIAVVGEKSIIEQGTHNFLLNFGGEYSKLYNIGSI